MANGFIATKEDSARFFLWNVESHVGVGCPNRGDDVELVQYGYYCYARTTRLNIAPSLRQVFAAVRPGALYTGAPADPLSIAIREHQKNRGGTQDGKVSPIQAATAIYRTSGSGQTWMIVALSNNIREFCRDVWPLIHRGKGCPPGLARVSKTLFDDV